MRTSELVSMNEKLRFEVSEKKKNEKELLKQKKQLSELIAAKDKFYSIIAHDLRSPFNNILGFAKLLSQKYDTYDDFKKKNFIEIINKESQNAFSLLENLLEWARIQIGRMEFHPQQFFLNEIIKEEITFIKEKVSQKKIQLSFVTDKIYPVFADKNMISTIFRNLLSNAVKFTPDNGIIKITCSEKLVANNKKFIEVIVSDTGVGINPEIIDKLFRIDETISTEGTAGEKGTGLGLILCKEFVEKHEGTIRVESEEGKGSKFIFTLMASINFI